MKLSVMYIAAILFGLAIAVYFYFFNFDNMSETELVNSVLYWYVPLIFGIYGIIATRIKSRMGDLDMSPIKYLFSGKDRLLIVLIVFIGCGGVIGLILLLIPLAFFKVQTPYFDAKVALLGTALCVLLLWVFFQVLWPAL
ncbi:MAG: hypothetical protein HKN48_12600 [Flavobacteriaceae bacterium]|nr:hypothetical protein [Flavobacteriaceae bacterium]